MEGLEKPEEEELEDLKKLERIEERARIPRPAEGVSAVRFCDLLLDSAREREVCKAGYRLGRN